MKPLKWKKSYKVFCLCLVTVCHSSIVPSYHIHICMFTAAFLPKKKKEKKEEVKKVDGSEAKFLKDEGSARQLAASRILKPCSFMMTD